MKLSEAQRRARQSRKAHARRKADIKAKQPVVETWRERSLRLREEERLRYPRFPMAAMLGPPTNRDLRQDMAVLDMLFGGPVHAGLRALQGEAKPVRLQLSRRKGFNLQALSQATNGLPAVNVARPSRWGNPFEVKDCRRVPAVLRFACEVAPLLDVTPLAGKNLACWCAPDQECHADVLLELANPTPTGEQG